MRIFISSLEQNAQLKLLWISRPYRHADTLYINAFFIDAQGKIYTLPLAWGQLPWLVLGACYRNGDVPDYKPSTDVFYSDIPCNAIVSQASICAWQIIPKDLVLFKEFNYAISLMPGQTSETPLSFWKDECCCFSFCGVRYIVPYPVIVRAIAADIGLLVNKLQEPELIDQLISSAVIVDDTIHIAFGPAITSTLRRNARAVTYLAWLACTPAMGAWFGQTEQYLLGKNYNGMLLPNLDTGKWHVTGIRKSNSVLVTELHLVDVSLPFRQIRFAIPDTDNGIASRTNQSHVHQQIDSVSLEGSPRDTTPTLHSIPSLDYFTRKLPKIQRVSGDKTDATQYNATCAITKPAHGLASSATPSQGGVHTPIQLTPQDSKDFLAAGVTIEPEFADFFDALHPYKVNTATYYHTNKYFIAVVSIYALGKYFVLIEPHCNLVAASSTLIAPEFTHSQDLINRLYHGSWDTKACKVQLHHYQLLRHANDRRAERWHALIQAILLLSNFR